MKKVKRILFFVSIATMLILVAYTGSISAQGATQVPPTQPTPSAVTTGTEGKRYDYISGLVFSPDGKYVAYIAKLGNKQLVVTE